MNIHQLIYFRTLCQTRNYTKAAEILYVSQPALSIAIRKLEKELGLPLFYSNGNKTELLDAGRRLLPLVERILADFDKIYNSANYVANNQKFTVHIGVPNYYDLSMLAPIRDYFTELDEGIIVSFIQCDQATAEKELYARHIDLAIMCKPEYAGNYATSECTRHELCAYMDRKHRLASNLYISAETLSAERLLHINFDYSLSSFVIEYVQRHCGLLPHFTDGVFELHTATQLLSDRTSVAIYPRGMLPENLCCQIPLSPPMYTELIFAYNFETAESPIWGTLQSFMKTYCLWGQLQNQTNAPMIPPAI